MKKFGIVLIALLLLEMRAMPQVLRSLVFNPPGADDGLEYIEITGNPNSTLSNTWFLEIDGDGANGNINTAINLGSFSSGANGLLLIRDASATILPAPSAATNIVVQNFAPDIQNGTATFLLVTGFTGSVGTDLDPDNDGSLNSTPWVAVLSAISTTDGTAGDDQYADDVGGLNFPDITTFEAEGFALQDAAYFAIDISGSGTGPFAVDAAWNTAGSRNNSIEQMILTPGNTINPLPVSLGSIHARSVMNSVHLSWIALHESGLSHYRIDRSPDGRNFSELAQIGARNRTDTSHYSYVDRFPSRDNYYRISAVDDDGAQTLSPVFHVRVADSVRQFLVHPNPVSNGQFLVKAWIAPKGKYSIILFTANGIKALHHQFFHGGGKLERTATLPGKLIPGIYLMVIKGPGIDRCEKLLIL